MSLYVVGVDGGTTKTVALVADGAGHILGAARRGGSNTSGSDVAAPMAVVAGAVQEALDQAGLQGEDVDLAMACLAGADWPEDHVRRQAALQAAGAARRVAVKNDAFAGLRAGTSQPYGVVIAAGTGTNTAAIAPDGREWHFGYYVDEGGGRRLVQAGMRAVLRAEDGRGLPTALTALFLSRLGYPDPEHLLKALVAREVDQCRLDALCPLVFEAAWAGDPVAAGIVVQQGRALAEYAATLIRRFDMQSLAFDVVLAGSVFKGRGPLLVDTVTQAIHQVAPQARIVPVRFEPVVGALLLAYDALGLDPGACTMRNLAATTPGPEFFRTAGEG
jgi:N-acetylglucosamine kinase-like BadF-type ATPase